MWDFLALRHQLENAEHKPTVVHSTHAGEPDPDVSVSVHDVCAVLSVVPKSDEASDPGVSHQSQRATLDTGQVHPTPSAAPTIKAPSVASNRKAYDVSIAVVTRA